MRGERHVSEQSFHLALRAQPSESAVIRFWELSVINDNHTQSAKANAFKKLRL